MKKSMNDSSVSAFTTYNLLKNCNYLFGSQSDDLQPKNGSRVSSDCPLQSPFSDDSCIKTNDYLLNVSSNLFLASAPFFGYPSYVHLFQNESILNARTCNLISSYPSFYNSAFKRQRGEKKPIPDEQKDDKYFERRRRNNQAAKKSRDARKIREDQIALKATILEHENAILKTQILTLREEVSSLRQIILQKKNLEITTRN